MFERRLTHTQIVPSRQSHEDTTGQSEKKALQCIASKCFDNNLIHELSDAKSQKTFYEIRLNYLLKGG